MITNIRIKSKNRNSFTLIELLVVLALVAILSVVVILTLNPAELIKQARDSNRLSDLSTINTALNLFSADVTSGFMGTSTVVYVSIPSASPTCVGLGLPTLPSGYTYNCVTTANLRNTNGTGWIPVNFQRISSNSPVSQLPVDPINTTSTRLYYTYVSGGSWELNATVEASKNKLGGSGDLVSKDGGSAISQYEIGNNLNLSPIETGDSSLVGYWNFEEGSGATTTDRSGYGNHGTWYGNGTHYMAGKVGNYAGQFNGVNDYSSVPNFTALQPGQITVSLWADTSTNIGGAVQAIITTSNILLTVNDTLGLWFWPDTSNYAYNPAASLPAWSNIVFTWDYPSGSGSYYFNGNFVANFSSALAVQKTWQYMSIGNYGGGFYNGYMDDLRIYTRVLPASEISALYNATK